MNRQARGQRSGSVRRWKKNIERYSQCVSELENMAERALVIAQDVLNWCEGRMGRLGGAESKGGRVYGGCA